MCPAPARCEQNSVEMHNLPEHKRYWGHSEKGDNRPIMAFTKSEWDVDKWSNVTVQKWVTKTGNLSRTGAIQEF